MRMALKYTTLLFAILSSVTVFSASNAAPLEGKRTTTEIIDAAGADDWEKIASDRLVVIQLERGDVVIVLSDTLAPNHRRQFEKLVRNGFYDGLSFYRVIEGFVAQGGDPFEARDIGDGHDTIKAEFSETVSDEFPYLALVDQDGYAPSVGFSRSLPTGLDPKTKTAWHLHCTGMIGFGRGDEVDSASTEFYIMLQPHRYLDKNVTVFGRVIEGMTHIQQLRRVAPPSSSDDDLGEQIVSMKMASDFPKGERPAYEYLSENSPLFSEYLEARRNRPSAWFQFRPDHLDICQLPFPYRQKHDETAN